MNSRKKPIAIVFTKMTEVPEYRKLQQIDAVGIYKVYLLLSNDQLMHALEERYSIFDERPQTVIEHYQSYLPQGKINFNIINTGNITSDKDKINFFVENVEDDNLINICFSNDRNLSWIDDRLESAIAWPTSSTTHYYLFGMKCYERTKLTLPNCIERRSPVAVDELLQRELNPVFCMRNSGFDIINYQGLFNCFVELITLQLLNDDSESAKTSREKISYLIKMYEEACFNLQNAEAAFEASHDAMYRGKRTPGMFQEMMHRMVVEKKVDAENAFPELIRNLIALYRELAEKKACPANNQKMAVRRLG